VNDSASGGLNRFSIQDLTAGRIPFTVEGDAPTNALYVDNSGRIGLRTNNPLLDLHIDTGNSPGVRFAQTGTGGFTPQTWDVVGNEANFFVRDATSGSRLPFRIRPGAPTSSIDISSSGNVGIGTAGATAPLHVQRADGSTLVLIKETDATSGSRTLLQVENTGSTRIAMKSSPTNTWLIGVNNNRFFLTREGSEPSRLRLSNSGDLIITGGLTQNAVTALRAEAVQSGDVLRKLTGVPIVSWADDIQVGEGEDGEQEATISVRHMSPDAAGFHAAFDLGADGNGIAPLDVATVALAAAQELDAISKQQASQIEALQAENAELRARLAAIEASLGVAPTGPSTEPSTDPNEPTPSTFIPLIGQ
jgi:hypothetical protein